MTALRHLWKDFLYDVAGALLMGIGIYCFENPANIAPGGVSGISIMINYLSGIPIGTMNFLLNIPIMAVGFVFLSRRMIYKTLLTVFIQSLVLDTVVTYIPLYVGDKILASVFGGVLVGAGMGIIFLRGATTGGTDIISHIVKKIRPSLPIGTAILLTDCVILVISVFVFEDIESGLYGLIAIFCTSYVIDLIIYGIERGNMVLVISEDYELMRTALTLRQPGGVLVFDAEGGHSGNTKKLILCAVRRNQFPMLKNIILKIDSEAFIAVTTAEQILGDGFYPKSGL